MTAADSVKKMVPPTRLAGRRLRLWGLAVAAIVAVLVLPAVTSDLAFLPRFAPTLGAGAIVAVFLAALVCEYIDSSLGMGYGTTLTPLLLLAGFAPLTIVPCVLLSELLTGLAAAIMHHRDGNVDFLSDRQARTTAGLVSLLSIVGAVAAVILAVQVPKSVLAMLIGVIILAVGIVTMVTLRWRLRYRRGHIVAIGAIAAFNKGLSGGGYGPLVTAGQVVSGLSAKKAVAITSLAESLTCLIGLTAYLLIKGTIDWTLAIPLSSGALLSVPVATMTVRHLPERTIRTCVGVATCLLGLFTLIKLLW